MVTTLAHSQHGRQYLAQQGIMDKISNMIRGADTDPFSSLYLPGGNQCTHLCPSLTGLSFKESIKYDVFVRILYRRVSRSAYFSSCRSGQVLWKPGHHRQPSAGVWDLPRLPEQGVWDGAGSGPCHDRCGSGHSGITGIHCGGEAGSSENRLECRSKVHFHPNWILCMCHHKW